MEAVSNRSDDLICCLVDTFTIKFLVMNVPRRTSGRSMINILSVIFVGSYAKLTRLFAKKFGVQRFVS